MSGVVLINSFVGNIAGQRMSELERKPDAPFVGASFGSSGFIRDLQIFAVGVSPKAGKSAAAFEATLRELRRLDAHGVLPTELERAKASLLRGRESVAAETGKTESSQFVGPYQAAFLNGNVIVSAQARYALAQRILPAITIDEVNAAIREASRGNDRFIAVVAPDNAKATLPTRDTLLAILARTDTATLPAWVETTVTTALVPHPPTPGRIVSETTYADIGVTDWHLSNGVRVLIKPTDFKADEVQIAGESTGGLSLAPDDAVIEAALASVIVLQSGIGDFDAPVASSQATGREDRQRPCKAGRRNQRRLCRRGLPSGSRNSLSASLAHGNRTASRHCRGCRVEEPVSHDAAAAGRGAGGCLRRHRDDHDGSQLAAGTAAHRRAHRQTRPRTIAGPLSGMVSCRLSVEATFLIVGNVSLDSLRPLVSQWLGGLPAAGAKHVWRDVEPRPPEGVITKVVRKGKAPGATQVIAFTGTTEPDGPQAEIVAAAAAQILQERLMDKLREAMGATYGVNVNTSISRVPSQDLQHRDRLQVVAANRSIPCGRQPQGDHHGVPQGWAYQGRAPEVRGTDPARSRGRAWKTNDLVARPACELHAMPDGPRFGRPISEMLDWNKRLDALTPAIVQDAAKRYLDPANVARFVLLPEN